MRWLLWVAVLAALVLGPVSLDDAQTKQG